MAESGGLHSVKCFKNRNVNGGLVKGLCFCIAEARYAPPKTKCLYTKPFPQLLVRAECKDSELSVILSSDLVCSALLLQRRVLEHLQTAEDMPKLLSEKETNEIRNRQMADLKGKVIDCRYDERKDPLEDAWLVPYFSEKIFSQLNEWSTEHLNKIRNRVADLQFQKDLVNWDTPAPKLPKLRKYSDFSKWEEKFFDDMTPLDFMNLVQAKNQLGIEDLHNQLENWYRLFRGRGKKEVPTDYGEEGEVEEDPKVRGPGLCAKEIQLGEKTISKQESQVVTDEEVDIESLPNLLYYHPRKLNPDIIASPHWMSTCYYAPQVIKIPNNAKSWAWWCRRYPQNGRTVGDGPWVKTN